MEESSYTNLQIDQNSNIRVILKKVKHNWYLFIAGILMSMIGAYVYIHMATPMYQTNAQLLIKEDKGSGPMSNLQNDILGQLSVLTGNSNVQNEIAILSSRTIIEKAIRDLGLQARYYVAGSFYRDKEVYLQTPVLVTPIFLSDSIYDTKLDISVNANNTFSLSDGDRKVDVPDGGTVSLKSGIFLLRKNQHPIISDTAYSSVTVVISSLNNVVADYKANLSLSQTDKTSSVIQLSLKTTVQRKGEDFLNALIKEYSLAGLADKNLTASNTINFVDGRLDSVSAELSGVEDKLQKFLSANSIANIDEQSKVFVDQASQLDQKIVQQNVQIDALKQILQYVSRPEKVHNLVPSTLGILDPTLLALVQNYNELQLKRSQQISLGAGPNNPMVAVMDQQLKKLRDDIGENTQNLLQGATLVGNNLNKQNVDFENKIRNVPRVQRDYIAIQRQQQIKQELYVYLLQKREEAAITAAASVTNNRIIDMAETNPKPIAPEKKMIVLVALLFALLLPSGWIYLKEVFSKRISSRQDVEARTQVPVFVEIGHSKDQHPIVVMSGAHGVVPEQFRNLRTNLSFVLGSRAHKVILITSSMGGEGKSFVSLNLAMSYALMGKRTVLLGLDLRKPKIGNYVGLEHHPGISNYLSGQLEIEKLPVELNFGRHNLYFINSGPIPPNPSELLLQPEIDVLFDFLKENFEYIILDTPPVGLVADAQILGKFADTALYIVRHKFTYKDQIELLNYYFKGKRLPNLGVVLNDIKAGDAYRYTYGSYGYGDGYYSEGKGDSSDKINGETSAYASGNKESSLNNRNLKIDQQFEQNKPKV